MISCAKIQRLDLGKIASEAVENFFRRDVVIKDQSFCFGAELLPASFGLSRNPSASLIESS
ncbi:hypothetical protein V511_03460 [Mesotoga sp. Brook.08.YT.4.2.5.1]|nr:hypothetical protein V511_03460 [Mesotoga sp. Brook.08.YT.4.2.5.1]PNS42691.1 hypothetical protein RJ60_00215 [Mesotoga sp. B105.6.4]PVD17282.1 hypothetical protein V512_010195 [Mesotoga sp. Brook.08.105.5.1]RAO98025.1 hypothetical protein M388_08135 [Mesotoga sp. Brook.08.YT.4.2.5.4.]RDI94407.1 hypothetical protein Q502_00230 [Mesotoga sp. Brook.08.YT.4.2.5.2.]HAY98026.1 hypothetical protein [Mesotoga sp.]